MTPDTHQSLVEKLSTLPADRIAEIDDFIDFLVLREQERALSRSAEVVSQPSFSAVWNNPEDDIYNAP